MQKRNIKRLLELTKFKPLKITHNVVNGNYSVLEYSLQGKHVSRLHHITGEKPECRQVIADLEKKDATYLHIN
jgi:hypothetical protein